MKYVRVYESDYEQEYIITYQGLCEHVANIQDNGFDFEGCIIKQAGTIKELCDEFVYQTSKGKRYIETYLSRNNGVEIINVYGAIWTDKGLIYVAKMNEKGELELL